MTAFLPELSFFFSECILSSKFHRPKAIGIKYHQSVYFCLNYPTCKLKIVCAVLHQMACLDMLYF